MGKLLTFTKRNIQQVPLVQLKNMWNQWEQTEAEDAPIEFHYEQIHAELNRRGEGEYCAV